MTLHHRPARRRGHGRPRHVHRARAASRPARSRRSRPSARPRPWRATSRPRTRRRSCSASTNGARGAVSVSQISAGRKNSLQYEIDGSSGAVAWDSEQPDQALARPPRPPQRDPASEPGPHGPRRAAPRRPCRAATSRASSTPSAALFRAVYADVAAGAPSSSTRPIPTFADGHDEMLVGDAIAAERARGSLGRRSIASAAAAPRRPSRTDGAPR